MLDIDIDDNPTTAGDGPFVYQELGPPRPVRAIKVEDRGVESVCDVTGVEPPGVFVKAYAQKVADSGAGYAYVIFGGKWGIRLRPEARRSAPWDLNNKDQRGEAFKLYGEDDIIYEN